MKTLSMPIIFFLGFCATALIIAWSCVRPEMMRTSVIQTNHYWIFHYLNDGNGNLRFQVKVFGLDSEISYSYWWF